jgi:arylsulfatase A-like enzyme
MAATELAAARRRARAAFAFGLAFGLGEAAWLLFAQESGRSRWPIALGVGRTLPWASALVDGLLAVALALVVALVTAAVPPLRRRASALQVVLLAAGAAYLGARIDDAIGRPSAAGIAAGVALVVAATARCVPGGADRVVASLHRIAWPLTLVVALIGGALEAAPRWRDARARAALPPAPRGAKSVLVVVWDTVRPDHLSAYGYARATSPRLAAIAAQGERFDAAFATSSWTLPSHASMVTGRLPREHGAGFVPLDATWPTLGEEFTARGWRSGAFSGNLCYFTTRNGFGRGFSTFDDFDWSVASRLLRTLAARELLGYADPARANDDARLRRPAADVNRAFLAWLDRAPGTPFFSFLNYFDAHAPYRPPPATRGTLGTLAPGDGDPPDLRRYDECIAECDARFGELVDALAQRGRLDDTVVVVLSDHGESFGENGAHFHRGSLQREQTQVAWIVRAPWRVAPATVVDGVTSLGSLPAQLLDLAGAGDAGPFPRAVESDEAVAIAELARHPWPEYRDKPCYGGSLRSIVKGRWHLVRHSALGLTLFDRLADPREEHDLRAERPAIASALARELDESLARVPAHADPFADDPDLATRGELAGLGYATGEER